MLTKIERERERRRGERRRGERRREERRREERGGRERMKGREGRRGLPWRFLHLVLSRLVLPHSMLTES